MLEIDLVDIGGGNLGSVRRCLEMLSVNYKISDPDNPPSGDRPVLLPGVGAFGPVMQHLKECRFDQRLKKLIETGVPYIGICVGMQILFEKSEEADGVAGLGILKGSVIKYRQGKVPQIGWNLIEKETGSADEFPDSGHVYFVNSYYPHPHDEADTLYSSLYYLKFCAAVRKKNVTAFQFHPEKSGEFGKSVLRSCLENV